jgi:formylglycine-generating enzyme
MVGDPTPRCTRQRRVAHASSLGSGYTNGVQKSAETGGSPPAPRAFFSKVNPPMRDTLAALALALASSALPACGDRSASAAPVPAAVVAPALPVVAADTHDGSEAGLCSEQEAPGAEDELATLVACDAPDLAAAAAIVNARALFRPPCPEGMALVDRFCVDRWEAVLFAPRSDGVLSRLAHNERPPAGVRFEARSLAGVMPQGYISRVEAARACKNAGKRLCSMREWRRACQGGAHTKYPYGSGRKAGRCNSDKPHLLAMHFGSSRKHWTYDDFNDTKLGLEPGFLAKTGEYERCVSDDAVFDMVGNLHEWVSDVVDDDLFERMQKEEVERRPQPWRTGNGVFMGGFFSTTDQHGPGCTFTTIAHEPTYHDYSIGFRCCATADLPPPAKRTKKKKGR